MTDGVQSNDEDTSVKDAENVVFKDHQLEVNRRAEIAIEPIVSCVQIEDVEQTVFTIVTRKDANPKLILMDEDFKVLAFPNLFSRGEEGFDVLQPRLRKLSLRKYINHRLLNVDHQFSQIIEYIFVFQYAAYLKQMNSDMQIALQKVKGTDFLQNII